MNTDIMKYSKNIGYLKFIFLIAISSQLLFSYSIAQDNPNLAYLDGSNTNLIEDPNEPANGFWMLSDVKTENKNLGKITNWVINSEIIIANARWIDQLNIEHNVSCTFEWDRPPDKLIPGTDNKIKTYFKNNEYSTTGKVNTGIKIKIDKIGKIESNLDYESIDILKLAKDYKNRSSEDKLGFFTVPKYYKGDNRTIELVVDCYIGNDHFISTYFYNWTE